MKIHLTLAHENEVFALFEARAALSKAHQLTADPGLAGLILILGNFGTSPHELVDHPLYKAFPDRCAVYTEDDYYLPLARSRSACATQAAQRHRGSRYGRSPRTR